MNIKAMKQAIEALKGYRLETNEAAIKVLEQAIEQAEEQPKEARYYPNEGHARVVWLGLTDEEILEIDKGLDARSYSLFAYTRAIEAKLRETNT